MTVHKRQWETKQNAVNDLSPSMMVLVDVQKNMWGAFVQAHRSKKKAKLQLADHLPLIRDWYQQQLSALNLVRDLLVNEHEQLQKKVHADAVSSRRDPIEYLTQECICHVFSFLCPPKDKTKAFSMDRCDKVLYDDDAAKWSGWDMKKAGQFYGNLASVSPLWKQSIDVCLKQIVPGIMVDMGNVMEGSGREFESVRVKSAMAWLGQHKLSIRSIKNVVGYRDDLKYVTKMIQECDTSQLTRAQLKLSMDLVCDFSTKRVPHQIPLQLALCHDCPSLHTLSIDLAVRGKASQHKSGWYKNYISHSLMTHPKLRALRVQLFPFPYGLTTIHGSFVQDTFCLGNKKSKLQYLKLICFQSTLLHKEEGYLQIQSKSLRCLDLERFACCSQGRRLSLLCPKMEACWVAESSDKGDDDDEDSDDINDRGWGNETRDSAPALASCGTTMVDPHDRNHMLLKKAWQMGDFLCGAPPKLVRVGGLHQ